MQLETNFNVKFAISMQNLSAILKSGVKGQISDGPIANIFIQDMFLPYTKFHACIIKRAILAYFCTRQPNYKVNAKTATGHTYTLSRRESKLATEKLTSIVLT